MAERMRHWRREGGMALVLTAWLVGACSSPSPAGPAETMPRPERTVTSNDGSFVIAWRVAPEPLPLNEPFSLEVMVFDAPEAVNIRSDVELSVDAAMPEHGHGMNVIPSVTRVGPGCFAVQGLRFHMPGRWELYFDVTSGGVTERAQVEVFLE